MNWQKLRKKFQPMFWQKKVIVTLTSLLEGLCRLCLASKLQEAFWRLKPRDTCERKRYFILIKTSCLKKCPGDQTFCQSNSPYFKMIFIIAKHVQKWPHFRLVLKGLQVPNTNLPGNNYWEEILFGYLARKSRYWCLRSKFRRKLQHFWEEKFSKHFTRMTRKSTYATSDAATSEGWTSLAPSSRNDRLLVNLKRLQDNVPAKLFPPFKLAGVVLIESTDTSFILHDGLFRKFALLTK